MQSETDPDPPHGGGPNRLARKIATVRRRIDIALRLGGVILLAVAAALARLCTTLVRSGGHHPATVVELLLTALLFVSAMAGLALVTLGSHLVDEAAIAERARRRR